MGASLCALPAPRPGRRQGGWMCPPPPLLLSKGSWLRPGGRCVPLFRDTTLCRIRPLEKHQPAHRTAPGLPVRCAAPPGITRHLPFENPAVLHSKHRRAEGFEHRPELPRSAQVDVPGLHDEIRIAGRRACSRPRPPAMELLLLAKRRRLRVPPNPCWG